MRAKFSNLVFITLLASLLAASMGAGAAPKLERIYVGFPVTLDPKCRKGKATLFDECGDQVVLFDAALERAKADGKVLLVEYGAEWCIWCHVFEAHINGGYDKFKYKYGSADEPDARYSHNFKEGDSADPVAANKLREFVAANFVIVHIDSEFAPKSLDVLKISGAQEHAGYGIPFIFTVDERGRFAAKFDHDLSENRRDTDFNWYRGYYRDSLQQQLASMRDAARGKAKATR
jgi:hypothetical protein